MRYKHEFIDVKISRRTLWVGSQVYPLQNVARVQSLEEVLDRGRLVWSYVKKLVKSIAVGAVLGAVITCGVPSGRDSLLALVGLGVLAMLAWHTYRFIRELVRPRLYFLVVETAGSPHAAVVSTDRSLITDLAEKVVEAIDNPAVDFTTKIENIVLGDQYNQKGKVNVGGGQVTFS